MIEPFDLVAIMASCSCSTTLQHQWALREQFRIRRRRWVRVRIFRSTSDSPFSSRLRCSCSGPASLPGRAVASAKFPANLDMARRTHRGVCARGRPGVRSVCCWNVRALRSSASYVALFFFLSRSLLVAVLFEVLLTASGNLLVTMARGPPYVLLRANDEILVCRWL